MKDSHVIEEDWEVHVTEDQQNAPVASGKYVLELKDISKVFVKKQDGVDRALDQILGRSGPPAVHALDDVSLSVCRGEVLGLVGESGCGKSTLGRIAAQIARPTSGQVLLEGRDVLTLKGSELLQARLKVQMIFQDPFGSLNQRMRVSDIISEAPSYHGLVRRGEKQEFIAEQLRRVELDASYAGRYPHQFSGGQRQRIGIARALAVNPEMLICDESVAALDVSIQAQVINLFMDLRETLGLTYLFISHDLGVIEHISDRIAIMYLGRLVEEAPTEEIFARPNHPYTQALLNERPRIDTKKRKFGTIKGEIPSPLAPPPGCHFHTRCPYATERCRIEVPKLKQVASGHISACHLNDDR